LFFGGLDAWNHWDSIILTYEVTVESEKRPVEKSASKLPGIVGPYKHFEPGYSTINRFWFLL
jgi:hypothetical protein